MDYVLGELLNERKLLKIKVEVGNCEIGTIQKPVSGVASLLLLIHSSNRRW